MNEKGAGRQASQPASLLTRGACACQCPEQPSIISVQAEYVDIQCWLAVVSSIDNKQKLGNPKFGSWKQKQCVFGGRLVSRHKQLEQAAKPVNMTQTNRRGECAAAGAASNGASALRTGSKKKDLKQKLVSDLAVGSNTSQVALVPL